MIITQREFNSALEQINVAFEVANEKIDKLEAEVKALTKITSEIKKPITCIIGGSKI